MARIEGLLGGGVDIINFFNLVSLSVLHIDEAGRPLSGSQQRCQGDPSALGIKLMPGVAGIGGIATFFVSLTDASMAQLVSVGKGSFVLSPSRAPVPHPHSSSGRESSRRTPSPSRQEQSDVDPGRSLKEPASQSHPPSPEHAVVAWSFSLFLSPS